MKSRNPMYPTLFSPRRALMATLGLCSLATLHAQFTLEMEDYNFENGQFIDNPVAGDFADKGVATPGVDFRDNTPTTRGANEYRSPAPGAGGLPQTAASGDAERTAGTAEVDLSSVELGEWTNYTRTFPAGTYSVTARVQALDTVDPFIARLEKVTSDPTTGDQTSTAYGVFLGRNASESYGDLEMTDVTGQPITISLDGEETLRLATQVGSYNINYLSFTPAATDTPMPRVDITAPDNDTGVMPGVDLEITLAPANEASVAAVQILANSAEGDEIVLAELGAPPFTATWSGVPEGTWRLLGIVADASGLVGLSSEVTIFSDGTPPELQQVRGRTTEDVILTFSESMSPATAGDPANYSAVDTDGNPLEILSASVTADGRVILGTAVQSVGTNYTLTVNNLTDLAGNPLPNGSTAEFFGNGPLLQTNLGFVVFEAEHFDRNNDGLWLEETDWGTPSGGVSMVVPNGGGGSEAETQLQYDINFVKTGTHYLWYRASAETGNDDSAWLWIDGARPRGREDANFASMSGFGNQLDFVWNSNAQDGGGLMSFEIDTPGFHTIAIAQREDGAHFDKFVVTTDPNFDPADPAFGDFGPPLTPREGEDVQGGNQVEITLDPLDVTFNEHDTLLLEADGTGTEGAVIVYQWQRQDGEVWNDIPNATDTTFSIERVGLEWNGVVVRMAIRTDGDEDLSDPATITINPETVAPELISANGQGERIFVLFSEPVDPATAGDAGNYQVSDGLQINDITLLPSGVSVILGTSAQTVGTKYTVTVSNVADLAATPNVMASSTSKFYSLGELLPQSEDGLLVFEAENFDENSDGLWETDSAYGVPSGGLSVVIPNGNGGNEESKLEYELTFTQTGEHILWYRAAGPSGTDDSAWFHLDGARPENRIDGNTASMTGFAETDDFVWLSNPQEGGGQMTFNIPSPGVYRIGLARREDGSQFDKFVVTTDPEFDPASFGAFGPAETRAGAPAQPTMTLPDIATVPEGGNLEVTPDISATERSIAKVEYFADGEKIGESTSAPFTFTWARPEPGFYAISAVLVDDVGDRVSAMAVDVTVEGDLGGGGGGTPTVDGAGKSVVWITQVASPAGEEFQQLLAQSAFEVTELMIEDPSAAEQETLNAADVVIVTRKVSSGNYNNDTWDTQISSPLILMSAYLSRANRWAWLGGDGLIDDTPETIVAEMPEHPIFQNVVLTDSVSGPWHTAVDRGTSIPTDPIANGGTVLATGNGNIIAAEWPADAVAAGPRMLFAAGSREPADPGAIDEAGRFNLTEEGGQAFLNAVLYMANQDGEPDPGGGDDDLAISVSRTANGVMVELSGAAAFDVEYSPSLAADSWTVIASDVTSFEDTDAARVASGSGYYRGIAK